MNNKVRKRNIHLAIVIAILSLYLIRTSFSYPANSSGFPRFLSVLLLLLSIVLFWRNRAVWKPTEEIVHKNLLAGGGEEVHENSNISWWRNPVLLVSVIIVIYALLIKLLGFFPATIIQLVGSMLLFGNRSWLTIVLSTTTLIIFLYIVFSIILGAPL